MTQLFANNIKTTISGTVLSGDLTFTVASAAGMPTPVTVSDYFYGTFSDSGETAWEVVKVTNVTGTTLTVLRGQDGTSAAGWASGSLFQIRGNAGMFRDIQNGSSPFIDCGQADSVYAPGQSIVCGGA